VAKVLPETVINSKSRSLLILGAGGLGKEALWVAEEMNRAASHFGTQPWNILGYFDDNPGKSGELLNGYAVLGNLAGADLGLNATDVYYCCAIGNNQIRQQMVERVTPLGWQAATLVHPSAVIAPSAVIGEGTYVGAGTVVSPNAVVGCHVILNVQVSVGHDSKVNDFAQACPGVKISGGCVVEEQAFLGSNATLGPRIRVGRGAKLGANSYAVGTVKPGVTALGIPARPIG
jgi:sugar O-acyltransferase (sialic acid O-acetyltransferase NeuD family)